MSNLGFKESVVRTLKGVTDFDTCSSRSEYWYYQLFRVICAGIVFFLTLFIGPLLPEWLGKGVFIIIILFALYIVLADIPLSVRRLHDTGKSGWWYLVVCIPYIGWIALLYLVCQPSNPDSEYRENGDIVVE